MKQKRSRFIIGILLIICIVTSGIVFIPTLAKYILKITDDKIVGYFTDFYFTNNGNGKSVTLEGNATGGTAILSLSTYNFQEATGGGDAKFTGRDIIYTVTMPQELGNLYEERPSEPFNIIRSAWGNEINVYKESNYYDVVLVDGNNQELNDAQKKRTIVGGKQGNDNISLRITRRAGAPEMSSTQQEKISVVLLTQRPYQESFVMEITVSKQLLSLSTSEASKFGFAYVHLNVQTAQMFTNIGDTQIQNDLCKITIQWDQLRCNEADETFQTLLKLDNRNAYEKGIDGKSGKLILYIAPASEFNVDFYKLIPSEGESNITITVSFLSLLSSEVTYIQEKLVYGGNK